jgi:hypothetical protein
MVERVTGREEYDRLLASIPSDADEAASEGYRVGWSHGWRAAMAARDAREGKPVPQIIKYPPMPPASFVEGLARRTGIFDPSTVIEPEQPRP